MFKKPFKCVMVLLTVCLLAIGSISYQQITASAESSQTYTAVASDGGKKLNVTVTAGHDALPEGVSLKVSKVNARDSEYKTVKTKVESQNKNKDVSFLAYDIGFYKDGKKVEPSQNVQVTMSWNSAIAPSGTSNADTVSFLHVSDAGHVENLTKKAALTRQTNKVKSVTFKTRSFSVYALTWVSANSVTAAESTNEPLDVSSYITGADIYYLVNDTKIKIEDNTTIPDTATGYSIDVKYANINSQDLLNKHDRQITYTLPSQLSSLTLASNDVYDDSTPPQSVGTITAADNKILITFKESHLSGDSKTTTSGTFTFNAAIDRTKNTENPLTIKIGNVTKTLKFQEHETAETGSLNIEKSTPKYVAGEGEKASEEGYLEYTLTVTTGDDAMPDVHVDDSITNGGSYVTGYLVAGTKDGTATSLTGEGLTSGTVTVSSGGKTSTVKITDQTHMTWTIGDMGANETRTLTYRIKLNKDYVGVYNTTAITNTAKPYSKTYQHGQASKSFTPSEKASVNKTAGDVTTKNGQVTIPYTITITADSSNTWPIRNLKINDHLQNSYKNQTNSDEIRKALCQYARFANFTVKLGDEDKTSAIVKDSNPVTYYGSGATDRNHDYNPSFDMYVGDIPAGTTLTITYDLQIDEAIFTKLSRTWTIKNNVSVHTDDSQSSKTGYNASVGSAMSTKTIGTQIWDRKVMASNLTQTAITQSPEGMDTKTVPSGAIKYQVVVNEAGEWDVSQSTLTDTLGDHLKYSGYLQIDYYSSGITYVTSGENVTLPDDSNALASLTSKTATKTVYKLIDGETSFTFKPSELGLTDKGAYVLTYYAVPDDVSSMSKFTASNTFGISGTVIGPGGTTHTMSTPSSVKVSKVISGGADFKAEKRAWYYDSSDNAAYWVIEATGTSLPSGLALKDVAVSNNSSPEVVGAYVGTISTNNGHLSDAYNTISDFNAAASNFDKFTDYTWKNNTFTFNSALTLNKQKTLYIIIKTNRSTSESNKRNTVVLENKLQLKEVSEDDFRDVNTASLTTVAGGDVFKELGAVYTRDSSGNWEIIKSNKSNNISKIVTSKATEAGTYIEWRIKVNQLPNLDGYYDITDDLPSGVEAVYARYFWVDTTTAAADRPTMESLSLGSSWSDIGLKDAAMDGSSASAGNPTAYAYYNKTENKIKFRVGNLKKVLQDDTNYTSLNDKRSLEVQILVKVTDADYLLGSEKTFSNGVSMTDAAGHEIGKDTSAVTTKTSSLTKASSVSNQTINGVVPFTLTINPLGADLMANSDTITVIDEMADPLSYDLSSIKVTNASDEDITKQIKVQDGGKTSDGKKILKFIVPDNQKLTITYNAIPYVSANTSFTVSNTVYWEGASSDAKSTVSKTIKNSVSATSTTNRKVAITVTKRDAADVSTLLSGATFKLTPVSLNGESWEEDGTAKTATSDGNGKLTFNDLEFNQVYKLEETKAPDGYNLDGTARYIVVTKNTGTTDNPKYPDVIKTYASHGAVVQYTGWQYSVDISNEAGSALPNAGGKGTFLYSAVGSAVIFMAAFVLYQRKRRTGAK